MPATWLSNGLGAKKTGPSGANQFNKTGTDLNIEAEHSHQIANSYVWFLRPKCDVSPYLCLKWSQRVAPEHNNKKNNLDVSCLAYFSSGFCKLYRPKFGIKLKFILVVPPCILNRQSARTHRKCPAQHWTQQVQCNNSFFYVWNMAAPSSWLIIT